MKLPLFFFRHYFFLLLVVISHVEIIAQNFTSGEYEKALWMTTRMYGGQRSGEGNWLVHDHLPSGVNPSLRGKCFISDQDTDGYDLSGGWHDAGDHVKFGHTQFYSAYMLLKGYAEFPTGYDDYYSYDYQGYKSSGIWTWEGNQHDPNGIPDVLDEVKHATDFFIKCSRNSSTFYYQVGQGDPDHSQWVTAVKMQTLPLLQGGQPRVVYKNPSDASMASFCGAALALMSRMYKKFDPSYANLCLQHAIYAYDYAKAHPGVAGAGDGSFYGPNGNWKDDYATMCAELFWATNNTTYKTEALGFSVGQSPGSADVFGNGFGFDYENNGDIAIYNLALLGKANARTVFNSIITSYYKGNVQADGQYNGGNLTWGPLRYNANTALMVALWQKLEGTDATPDSYIYNNIDYILGSNSANQSFVVGFGTNSPDFPHHRNIYLRDDNPGSGVTIPVKNAQAGLLLGGTRDPSAFVDNMSSYQHTEGGIDNNACLVGTLAFIISKIAPVDTSKFGHPMPHLGLSKTLCGIGNLILDSQIPVDGKKKFEWLKNGIQVLAPSTSATTYSVNSAGRYTCVVDSAGIWSTQASVEVTSTLPDVDLGADHQLCDPATVTLDLVVTGTGITYSWKKNGSLINGANDKTLDIYAAGTYRGTISALGCTSKFDEVIITSSLPEITHDTICAAGQVQLAVSGSGGPYQWYNVATGGSVINTGTTYSPSIISSTTYYVLDVSSVSATAGPSASANSFTGGENAGLVGITFTAAKAFSITQVTAVPYVYYCDATVKLKLTFQLKQAGTVLATYTSNEVPCTGTQSGPPFDDYYTFTFPTPIDIPAAGTYELLRYVPGDAIPWFQTGADYSVIDVPGVMDIIDDTRLDKPTSFPGVFDIKIQVGTGCARAPVLAVLDPCTAVLGKNTDENNLTVYPNPSASTFSINSSEDFFVKVLDASGRLVTEFKNEEGKNFGKDLPEGMYHIIFYQNGKVVKTFNVLKY